LYHGKATLTDKKSAIAHSAFEFHPAVPLAFVFNEFDITLRYGSIKGEQGDGKTDKVFQGISL
jgi:hypothetical protein